MDESDRVCTPNSEPVCCVYSTLYSNSFYTLIVLLQLTVCTVHCLLQLYVYAQLLQFCMYTLNSLLQFSLYTQLSPLILCIHSSLSSSNSLCVHFTLSSNPKCLHSTISSHSLWALKLSPSVPCLGTPHPHPVVPPQLWQFCVIFLIFASADFRRKCVKISEMHKRDRVFRYVAEKNPARPSGLVPNISGLYSSSDME